MVQVSPLDAGESGEEAVGLERPEAEPVLLDVRLDTGDQGVALLPDERRREEAHDLRVGVDRSKRRPVVLAPAAQEKAFAA